MPNWHVALDTSNIKPVTEQQKFIMASLKMKDNQYIGFDTALSKITTLI